MTRILNIVIAATLLLGTAYSTGLSLATDVLPSSAAAASTGADRPL